MVSRADVRAADGGFPKLTILQRPPFKMVSEWNRLQVAISAEACNGIEDDVVVPASGDVTVYCFYQNMNYEIPGKCNDAASSPSLPRL